MRKAEEIPQIVKYPFPHVIVRDFLDMATLDLVIDALAGLEYEFNESDLFSYLSFGLTDIDHPVINILRDDLGDEFWRRKVAEKFSVKPISKIDMGAYVYGLGDFLLPHDDQVEGRIIAYSLHLTDIGITEKMGGALHIYEADKLGKSTLVESLIPEYNSLIMFEVSNHSWHQVGEILDDIQRLTVTGWYHA
ncbi:MAG: hypothetical protein CXT75_08895 [Methanobacteriota archaeon]|jgi:Rps23 Pro-64 3,4-dihydroxylase Tpa1-like proline 4-hydroxylase|nr:MAG: hypothetical protein CXT75_08895 [Euryarchaeota archaeon]